MVLVHEADEGKGGAPLDELQAECREHCSPGTRGRLFTGAESRDPIRWVRAQEFQLVSLKQAAPRPPRDLPSCNAVHTPRPH